MKRKQTTQTADNNLIGITNTQEDRTQRKQSANEFVLMPNLNLAQTETEQKQVLNFSGLNNNLLQNCNQFTNAQTETISIIPTIQECEKFISFLNNKFSLNLPNDLIITIQKTSKETKGFFMPSISPEHYKRENTTQTAQENAIRTTQSHETQALNTITLSSFYLNSNPYETLAHELAHYLNAIAGLKDCSSNQYHNKQFKKQAEALLLKVSRTNKGYSHTEETEEFNQLLIEYGTNEGVFKILQNKPDSKEKVGSRLYLFTCSNDCFKVRCGDREFIGRCNKCGGDFVRV